MLDQEQADGLFAKMDRIQNDLRSVDSALDRAVGSPGQKPEHWKSLWRTLQDIRDEISDCTE